MAVALPPLPLDKLQGLACVGDFVAVRGEDGKVHSGKLVSTYRGHWLLDEQASTTRRVSGVVQAVEPRSDKAETRTVPPPPRTAASAEKATIPAEYNVPHYPAPPPGHPTAPLMRHPTKPTAGCLPLWTLEGEWCYDSGSFSIQRTVKGLRFLQYSQRQGLLSAALAPPSHPEAPEGWEGAYKAALAELNAVVWVRQRGVGTVDTLCVKRGRRGEETTFQTTARRKQPIIRPYDRVVVDTDEEELARHCRLMATPLNEVKKRYIAMLAVVLEVEHDLGLAKLRFADGYTARYPKAVLSIAQPPEAPDETPHAPKTPRPARLSRTPLKRKRRSEAWRVKHVPAQQWYLAGPAPPPRPPRLLLGDTWKGDDLPPPQGWSCNSLGAYVGDGQIYWGRKGWMLRVGETWVPPGGTVDLPRGTCHLAVVPFSEAAEYIQGRDVNCEGAEDADPAFPPGTASLGEGMAPAEWEKYEGDIDLDRVGPAGVRQGQLGDCYFCAALSSLAERQPERVRQLFNSGGSAVKLCGADGWWTSVTVDRYLPTFAARPLYCHRSLWAPLIEKAYAKLLGSYAMLNSGGDCGTAWAALAGAPSQRLDLTSDSLWGDLAFFHSVGFPMAAGTPPKDEAPEEEYNAVGLARGHAYVIVDVAEDKGVRACCLRDPRVERTALWKGAEVGWEARPEHGEFWISLADLVRWFADVKVCVLHRGWRDVRVASRVERGVGAHALELSGGTGVTVICSILVHSKAAAQLKLHAIGDGAPRVVAESLLWQ
eukprot:Sspe_Gene.106442::Locus_84393_Transcript_3_4_Confidence_0.250_Length_2349::g.106442::m.106442/K08582/CAPN15; calpain-15